MPEHTGNNFYNPAPQFPDPYQTGYKPIFCYRGKVTMQGDTQVLIQGFPVLL